MKNYINRVKKIMKMLPKQYYLNFYNVILFVTGVLPVISVTFAGFKTNWYTGLFDIIMASLILLIQFNLMISMAFYVAYKRDRLIKKYLNQEKIGFWSKVFFLKKNLFDKENLDEFNYRYHNNKDLYLESDGRIRVSSTSSDANEFAKYAFFGYLFKLFMMCAASTVFNIISIFTFNRNMKYLENEMFGPSI